MIALALERFHPGTSECWGILVSSGPSQGGGLLEPYSAEFRSEVLAACDVNEGTRAIALRFNVSESWIRRI